MNKWLQWLTPSTSALMISQLYTPTRSHWKPRTLQEMGQHTRRWEPTCNEPSVWQNNHENKIKSNFSVTKDIWCMWQGIWAIRTTSFHNAPTNADTDASLPDTFDFFYSQFKALNTVPARTSTHPPKDQELICPQHIWGRCSPESNLANLWDPTTSLSEHSETA